jgi:outer membrane lipoprotein-sorting protein
VSALSLVFLLATGGQGAESASAVLDRLDQSARGFRNVMADVVRVTHTAIINDNSEESGHMKMIRSGSGVQVLIEFTRPDAKVYVFRDKKAEVYYPKIQTIHEYDLGKSKSLVEQFLLLGFGTSGKDLSKSYMVTAGGEDSINGAKATRLELAPKSAKVKEYFSKVELWIPLDAGYPVRQKFHQASGDTTTITYSNPRLNTALTSDALLLKAPVGAKREYPQK